MPPGRNALEASSGFAIRSECLQDVDGSRSEKCDRRQGYGRLDHHQDFGPSRQRGNISWRKGGAGVEGEEQVIDKAGAPLVLSHFLAKIRIQDHLWKQECAIGVGPAQGPVMWSSRIQPPVPASENQQIAYPKRSRRP